MSLLTTRKVLVLNKHWIPVGTTTLQDSIVKLFSTYDDNTPKARIVEGDTFQVYTWDDWAEIRPATEEEQIFGVVLSFKVPEVILLSRYEKLPKPKMHFARKTLIKRDKYMCGYCGCRLGSDWTNDHILPRCQGGRTTYENCVSACAPCNRKKGDRTLKQAGMKLLVEPKKPDEKYFRFDVSKPYPSWYAFLDVKYFEEA